MIIPTKSLPKLPRKIVGPEPERTWQEVLELAGYPTDVLVLDFETYFDTNYTLRKLSTIEYIEDRRFEMIGVAAYRSAFEPHFYAKEDGVRDYLTNLVKAYGPALDRGGKDAITVVCQNARFDGTILARKYGIRPKYFIDLLGLANHWNARAKNSLAEMAQRAGLPSKGNTLEFKGMSAKVRYARPRGRGKRKNTLPVAMPVATADQWAAMEEYANHDAYLEMELLKRYLPLISNPAQELRIMAHTLNLYFDPAFQVDYDLADALRGAMDQQIDEEMSKVGSTREEISGENSFEALMFDALEECLDDPIHYTKPAKNKRGYKLAIAKDDPDRQTLENHTYSKVRGLMAAKAALSSWPNHIKRVTRIVGQSKAAGGFLPVPLNYHGAHTGRWSGGEKINLQNLGSRGHELVNKIRELLIVPEGHELVIVDSSQIEARVLAWIAGQNDKVEKFRRGEELYCQFASRVLHKTIIKPHDGMDEKTYEYMKWARNSIGKVGDLACGYGGGVAAVHKFAPDLDEVTKASIVDEYRGMHPKVKKFWYGIQSHFIHTAKHGQTSEYRGLFQFYRRPDCDVVIKLPNGRELKYHEVNIKDSDWGPQIRIRNPKETKRKQWDYLWGGTLTENVDQAISRDVLWHGIELAEATGWIRIIHHIHDEIIGIVEKGRGQEALDIMMKALRTVPSWAKGLPLDAEGLVTDRYGGH